MNRISPILFLKGYLGPKDSAMDLYDIAKGEFIISSFTYLGMFFAFLGGANIGNVSTGGKLIAIVFLIHYLYIIVKSLKGYFNQHSHSTQPSFSHRTAVPRGPCEPSKDYKGRVLIY